MGLPDRAGRAATPRSGYAPLGGPALGSVVERQGGRPPRTGAASRPARACLTHLCVRRRRAEGLGSGVLPACPPRAPGLEAVGARLWPPEPHCQSSTCAWTWLLLPKAPGVSSSQAGPGSLPTGRAELVSLTSLRAQSSRTQPPGWSFSPGWAPWVHLHLA